jgi:hypothetical protein
MKAFHVACNNAENNTMNIMAKDTMSSSSLRLSAIAHAPARADWP